MAPNERIMRITGKRGPGGLILSIPYDWKMAGSHFDVLFAAVIVLSILEDCNNTVKYTQIHGCDRRRTPDSTECASLFSSVLLVLWLCNHMSTYDHGAEGCVILF